ncbi:MAG: CinA family protein [Selenomonadaceae bacterium]|nr:CinA family protein [Selenomonadaceae bacterium]
MLTEKNLTIACAESCTGGLLTSRLTDVSGSSAYVKGSVVAYSNEIKISALNVHEQTLENFGAVSEQTALEMAAGIRKSFNTSIGLSITGIAGPTGGTDEKPVGLVYIAVSGDNGDMAKKFSFNGTRTEIKQKAVEAALVLIQVYLTLEKSF